MCEANIDEFLSVILASAVRLITISTSSPDSFFVLIVFRSSISKIPSFFTVIFASTSALDAVPPT